MTTPVEELTAYCESRFPLGQSTVRPFSVTGEEYTEIPLYYLGSRPMPFCLTEQDAVVAAKFAFDDYADGKTGTLYWRIKPETEYSKHHNCWKFYMRLLISDKPPIEKVA